jgi:hypothetical protein
MEDSLTTAARAVAEMATAFTAEVDRLRARIRELEADRAARDSELRDAYADIQRRAERIHQLEAQLEARPVGGAEAMREAAYTHFRNLAQATPGTVGWVFAQAADEARALPLPTPSPSTEPDAVPEGHRRVWIRIAGWPDEGGVASLWEREPEQRTSTLAIVVVDLPIAPTVRGAVVGGGQ